MLWFKFFISVNLCLNVVFLLGWGEVWYLKFLLLFLIDILMRLFVGNVVMLILIKLCLSVVKCNFCLV